MAMPFIPFRKVCFLPALSLGRGGKNPFVRYGFRTNEVIAIDAMIVSMTGMITLVMIC